MKRIGRVVVGSIASGLLSIVLGSAEPTFAHPVTSKEYKDSINFAEIYGNVYALCVAQMLGFWDTKRAQEFTNPLLTNTVNSGKLKHNDPALIYKKLDKEMGIDANCPGIISASILLDTSQSKIEN